LAVERPSSGRCVLPSIGIVTETGVLISVGHCSVSIDCCGHLVRADVS
jgi:hypothetical protein